MDAKIDYHNHNRQYHNLITNKNIKSFSNDDLQFLRETVAGDATAISPVSNRSVTCSGMAIRSPLVNVRILLSSITEFIDSIQTASIYSTKYKTNYLIKNKILTGQSNNIHF
jgi:hypothetical protein